MIKKILIVICSLLLFQSCKNNEQYRIIKSKKIESSESRYCFIKDIKMENQKTILLFDQVEYKNDTSEIDHKIIEMPDGFYFSDKENKIDTAEFDSGSVIVMQTFSFDEEGNFNFNEIVKTSELIEAFEDSPIVRLKQLPFRIVTTGTKIDSLFEIYIP